MKRILILGSISIGLVLSSCNSSNRVVSNFYEDGIYYNPAIGNMPKGSLASNEQNQREQASAVEDYFDPNFKSSESTIVNNNFYSGGFNPMWSMGFNPMWGMGFNPMWMRPGFSMGIGWGMGWNSWGMGWRSSWMYNPWMWDPWMGSMMWDPFWGHPMAWGNPWMNPWHPGFGWGPGWISNQPPRVVTPVRGIRSGSYANTGSGTGRKISTPSENVSNRTSQMRNSRESVASESARPTSRIAQSGTLTENPSSRLRASDLRTTRDMTSSSSAPSNAPAISRNGNYADRLNTNSLRSDRIQSGANSSAASRPSAAPLQSGQSARQSYSSPISRGQSSTPATRQYSRGQMETLQARPIQRQGIMNQSAPASRQSIPSTGGSRQFNSSPSFNSGGGATRGGGSTGGGRLR